MYLYLSFIHCRATSYLFPTTISGNNILPSYVTFIFGLCEFTHPFTHPIHVCFQENIYSKGSDLCVASIFSHATVISTQDPANCHHLTPGGGGAYHITAATTWLASDGEAHYAMVTGTGSILLVKLPPTGIHGMFTCPCVFPFVLFLSSLASTCVMLPAGIRFYHSGDCYKLPVLCLKQGNNSGRLPSRHTNM